jgi:hypothetical protein
MLIETSLIISPLASIGIAVRKTSSGGGTRNGLKRTVERNCQVSSAIKIDAVAKSAERKTGDGTHRRAARKGGSAAALSGAITTVQQTLFF